MSPEISPQPSDSSLPEASLQFSLPDMGECREKFHAGVASPLEEFIFKFQPFFQQKADFRQLLTTVLRQSPVNLSSFAQQLLDIRREQEESLEILRGLQKEFAPRRPKQEVLLYDWSIGHNRVFGRTKNHPTYPDGSFITSSRIVSNREWEGVIETANTIYLLQTEPYASQKA